LSFVSTWVPPCWWGPCCSSFLFFVLWFLVCLSSSHALFTQCCQCLWIVHSWLLLQSSLTFIYLQNNTQKIKDWATWTPLKSEGELVYVFHKGKQFLFPIVTAEYHLILKSRRTSVYNMSIDLNSILVYNKWNPYKITTNIRWFYIHR